MPRSPVLGISVADRHYGLFAPRGATWEGWGSNTWTCRTDKSYFSVAVLPDASEATLELFRRYAYSHVRDSRVSWAYDEATATLTTTYSVSTVPVEGDVRETLFALYPHQWRHTDATLLPESYASVRGRMRLTSGTQFQTTHAVPGRAALPAGLRRLRPREDHRVAGAGSRPGRAACQGHLLGGQMAGATGDAA